MARWLRALSVLSEDSGSVPAPTWCLTSILTPLPRDPVTSFELHRHQEHTLCTYACRQVTHLHTIK